MKSTLIKRGFVTDLGDGSYILQIDSKKAVGDGEGEGTDDEDDTRIQVRRILIKPSEAYRSIFNDAASANTNIIMESDIPLDDADYQAFFVRAIAKEAKALSASSGVFESNISSSNRYKAFSLNTLRPGKPQIPYIDSSIQESLRAITKGAPVEGYHEDKPTTLFLYYRKPDGIIPIYSGHIFVQPIGPWLFFVSIYKSMFEPEKGLSEMILDDVIAYAKAGGFIGIITSPLESMKSTLIKRGFVTDWGSGSYMLRLDRKNVAGGAGVTQGGGRKRKNRRKTRKRL